MNFFGKSIAWKLFPILIVGTLVCSVGAWISLPIYTERGVMSDVRVHAEKMVQQFKIIRGYYTENVIGKAVRSKALKPTYTHKGAAGEIPLPATFIHDLSELMAETGTTLKLYSPYPFPGRAQRELDAFGESAWGALSRDPDKSFVRTETIAGRSVVRVAVADTMASQVCVDCHNSRADTPKNDWRLNDLRGVLEIHTDVTAALARGAWIGRVIALAVLGVLGAVLALTYLRAREVVIKPIGGMTNLMGELANGNLKVSIPGQDTADEIGDMARAVQVFKENAIEFKMAQDELDRVNAKLTTLNATLEDRIDQRTSELWTANKELEDFAYSVSHDLRTPLRAVDGFSKILLSHHLDQLDDRGKRYLGFIRAGVQRVGVLIDDLLKLTRSTRGDLEMEAIDLSDIATQIVDLLRDTDRSRDLVVDIEPGIKGYGESRSIHVVMENLLENAWKYTRDVDHAHIAFGALEVDDGVQVYFVKDNGAGFDMRYANKLFAPFERLHWDGEFEGNGVGLAMVQRIVVRHGGGVWADARIGKGATFYFTLSDPKRRSLNNSDRGDVITEMSHENLPA